MDLTGKTILICDDSILARKQLMDAIKEFSQGVTFVEAANGTEAVEKYKETSPSIAFLDIVMPKTDGTSALKEIRQFDPEAIVIIVSSIGTGDQIKKAIELGAKDFIQKPIDKAQIKEIIEARLKGI